MSIESLIANYTEHLQKHLIQRDVQSVKIREKNDVRKIREHSEYSTEVGRELDILVTRILFGWLKDGHSILSQQHIISLCDAYMGNRQQWLRQFQEYKNTSQAVVVNVMTWQCEIRCLYCTIPKQDGKVISKEILDQSRELLLSAPQSRLQMRYFGGEPLLEWSKIQYSISSTWEEIQNIREKRCQDKEVDFLITTNGIQLDAEKISWMSQYPISLQIALDGLPESQNRFRVLVDDTLISEGNTIGSYHCCAIDKAPLLHQYGIRYTVIQVVHPSRIHEFVDDFRHIIEKGFEIVQINWAHNTRWSTEHIEAFAHGLFELGKYLRQRWTEKRGPYLVNLKETLLKVRVPQELTVDWDGKIYANNMFLFRPSLKDGMYLGQVKDGRNWLHYKIDGLLSSDKKAQSFAPKIFDNNASVGAVFSSWISWMQQEGIPDVDSWIVSRYK